MPDRLIRGLRRFRAERFPAFREHYERLVSEGQHPHTLFIGCSDSRVVPHLLMDAPPGELFIVRNIGAFVPPFEPDAGHHATSAAIEYAVLALGVTDIVVCGHSHCGAVRALYSPPDPATPHINRWLELGMDARLDEEETRGPSGRAPGEEEPGEPVAGAGAEVSAEAAAGAGVGAGDGGAEAGAIAEDLLRRTERRCVALQLSRLTTFPMVRERVEEGRLALHGWHYVIEDGRVDALDVESGEFRPLV